MSTLTLDHSSKLRGQSPVTALTRGVGGGGCLKPPSKLQANGGHEFVAKLLHGQGFIRPEGARLPPHNDGGLRPVRRSVAPARNFIVCRDFARSSAGSVAGRTGALQRGPRNAPRALHAGPLPLRCGPRRAYRVAHSTQCECCQVFRRQR
ncbi:hypothetical protein CEXT_743671 [Caerostris extrusa]|uniref:Uncharacterized protein n=1 Tax=Caerostris extrusa TaxID=172846 RepID=A0AAV4NQQ9_CAEEX|nr:hypothetical protein CEXT_743671 [Caerostris extrusa]